MTTSDGPADRRVYWNERYGREQAVFGQGPNQFVAEHLSGLRPQRVLDAACGQGRNAVWLAEQGHVVTGVDLSSVAVEHARELAAFRGVEVEFVVSDLMHYDPGPDRFDLVLLSYLQLPAQERRRVHRRLAGFLAERGRVFLIAHHADNLVGGVGGPDRPEVLVTESDVAEDFAGLEIERNEIVLREVDRDDMKGTAIDLLFVARRAA